uniref:Uncharacterized protein n=1 Tax=Triticum urartu TaxID=4572 RepID=A0A8R7V1C7_TRIUA
MTPIRRRVHCGNADAPRRGSSGGAGAPWARWASGVAAGAAAPSMAARCPPPSGPHRRTLAVTGDCRDDCWSVAELATRAGSASVGERVRCPQCSRRGKA